MIQVEVQSSDASESVCMQVSVSTSMRHGQTNKVSLFVYTMKISYYVRRFYSHSLKLPLYRCC